MTEVNCLKEFTSVIIESEITSACTLIAALQL